MHFKTGLYNAANNKIIKKRVKRIIINYCK